MRKFSIEFFMIQNWFRFAWSFVVVIKLSKYFRVCFTGFSIVIFFGAIFQRLKAFAQLFSASLVMLEAEDEVEA